MNVGPMLRTFFGRLLLPAVLGLCLLPGRADAQPADLLAQSGIHGGLAVHVGGRDADWLVALAQSPGLLVHGLVADGHLETVRRAIRGAEIAGQASAMVWDGGMLPYSDGMVNLLLVDEAADLSPAEIERVLVPFGAAWTRRNGAWTVFRQPWPEEFDEWPHSRYDASGNAVSRDRRAGPPRYVQWETGPRWNRSVKTSSMVAKNGRIFYILDDSHFASAERTWALIARDARNGILLWRHELPTWSGSRGGKKVGPAQVHRQLVADGDWVYAPLADAAPISQIDAVTGEVLRTFAETERAEEIIVADGILVALVNPNTPTGLRRGIEHPMHLAAFAPATGRELWRHPSDMIMPMTMASDGSQVVFHDSKVIRSLDLRTGETRWNSPPTGQEIAFANSANPDRPGAEAGTILLAPQFAPTLVIYGDVVAFAGGRQLNVVSATDGRELWKSDFASSNYSVPVDLFGFDGRLWGPNPDMNLWRPLDDSLGMKAFDPLTGEVVHRADGGYGFPFQHHRCHQMKVVADQVVAARAGIEFLDTATGEVAAHHWLRGSCYYGIMPANGLLYVPPHDCACYVRAKLTGFMAFNAHPASRPNPVPEANRLRQGPAYGQLPGTPAPANPDDWPTYRRDMARSGRATTRVEPDLLLGWQTPIGGRLTSPVVANNRLYLAEIDTHRLHAIDAETGQPLWTFTFDGRVDSPPTVHDGIVLCGSRDGTVAALRAEDGALLWRFHAAPDQRLIVVDGQLESPWPVHGSVLVVDGVAYFAAGKSSYLDGGIRFYGVDARTGRTVVERTLWTREGDAGQRVDEDGVDGYLNDILSSNGERIFMRHQVLGLDGESRDEQIPHLHSPDGYRSAETTARLLWTYAPTYTSRHQGAFYDQRVSRMLFPSGRILVEGGNTIYGFGQNHYNQPNHNTGGQWALFAAAKEPPVPLDLNAREYLALARAGETTVTFNWWTPLPIQVWALVRTENLLYVAGPRGGGNVAPAALAGRAGAMLLAVNPADGEVVAEMALPAMPVWDGMAAAGGNLYLSLANGEALCLWPAAPGREGTPLTAAGWQVKLPPVELAPEPGLVGRWRFDEGIGLLARDCSGQGHDALIAGRWAKGDFGTCLVASGSPQAAAIPDAEHLHFGTGDFTLALWVKVDGHDVRILGKEAFPENWWVVNLLANGRAELVLGEGREAGATVRPTTETPIATDAWTHLVAVADREAAEVRWYLNGQLDSTTPIPPTMTKGLHGGTREISIPSSHKPFRGLVGDFRIYRRALAAERVRELFAEQAERRASIEFEILD